MNRHNQSVSVRNFRQASILIVEDNTDHWNLIRIALERTLPEVEPVWASNPKQALAYLDECLPIGKELPKLILLDLYMPERKDGQHLLQQIKAASSPYKQVPVVVLSASDDQDDITESYYSGSTSYVTKPLDAQMWFEYLKTLRMYWWETVTLPSDGYMM